MGYLLSRNIYKYKSFWILTPWMAERFGSV